MSSFDPSLQKIAVLTSSLLQYKLRFVVKVCCSGDPKHPALLHEICSILSAMFWNQFVDLLGFDYVLAPTHKPFDPFCSGIPFCKQLATCGI
ncbi:hypothetical protein PsorP6_013114 [Peronosclerospora sorghi]|uniref:Uncharacterized protein n=1 Tax=Peronosclerospora sorghi TaxID=230839 RepID=A0ACC0WGI7_9STRA|nr:hypothetical protein PsorP6_013114 [Peronosclerospora sorghi]